MKQLILAILILFSVVTHAQSANSYIIKGNKYYTQTQFDLAEGQYKKALSIDQGNTTAQFNLANALQKQKKYDEAVQVLEKLYNAGPETKLRSATAYNQGVAYTKQKELEPSIEAYKKALRLNPNDKDARENLQKALSELKKKQDEQKQSQQKSSSSMSQNEAEQKLKLLQEKEKQLQQKLQNQNKQKGGGQAQDW
jgi:Ca-activated chloride channel homolog